MITNTLKCIDTLDYIFLVNKSNDNRLTTAIKYVYEQIQNMFAKDLEGRILGFCTFSDGKQPLCIDAMKAAKYIIFFHFVVSM